MLFKLDATLRNPIAWGPPPRSFRISKTSSRDEYFESQFEFRHSFIVSLGWLLLVSCCPGDYAECSIVLRLKPSGTGRWLSRLKRKLFIKQEVLFLSIQTALFVLK